MSTLTILPFAEVEKRTILDAIEICDGDILEAARQLHIGKTTIYRKLKEWRAVSGVKPEAA